MDKKILIDKIQDYSYYSARLKDVQEQIEEVGFGRVTATYGNITGGSGNGLSNKVEVCSIKRYDLHKKEYEYKKQLAKIKRLIEHSGLDKSEKGVMWCIAKNGKLQAYARRERIGKYNVYKIRDRAINKIIAAHKTHIVL